jgi:hypothetical protein
MITASLHLCHRRLGKQLKTLKTLEAVTEHANLPDDKAEVISLLQT